MYTVLSIFIQKYFLNTYKILLWILAKTNQSFSFYCFLTLKWRQWQWLWDYHETRRLERDVYIIKGI